MNGELRRVSSVPGAFAEVVVDALAVDTSGDAGHPRPAGYSIFLSGGPTAERCYRRLAACDPGTDWSGVDVYMGDERCVPPDHPDSNHRMVAEVLLGPVGPVRSDHPMYRTGSPEEAAAAYQRELEALSRFDVVHLGMGPDGHCASLFPGSAALAEVDPSVLVMANRDPQADNPHDRITLTLPAIARARLVVFTVSGASKRPALEAVMAGEDLPAARVVAERVIWLADEAAAGPR
ncbi:MAG: 6-phosphogluconolactonase [Acidimicrobiales bacterium]